MWLCSACAALARTLERRPAGEELCDDAAEGPQVGAVVGVLVVDHLGRHVLGRPHKLLELAARVAAVARRRPADQLGGAEVDELGAAVGREHHVLGLEVAVDDVEAVEVLQHLEELRGVERRPAVEEAAAVGDRPQLAAGDQLEHEVERAAVLERVEELDDRRVLDVAEHPLLDEHVRRLLVPLHLVLVDHLERVPLLRRAHRHRHDLRVVALAEHVADREARHPDVAVARLEGLVVVGDGGGGGGAVRRGRRRGWRRLILERAPLAVDHRSAGPAFGWRKR